MRFVYFHNLKELPDLSKLEGRKLHVGSRYILLSCLFIIAVRQLSLDK